MRDEDLAVINNAFSGRRDILVYFHHGEVIKSERDPDNMYVIEGNECIWRISRRYESQIRYSTDYGFFHHENMISGIAIPYSQEIAEIIRKL